MDKKTKILIAATKIFSSAGYENASVDDIVEKAGVAKGTFYYYFKSKEDVFISLIRTGIEQLSEFMRQESAKHDKPEMKVTSIIESQYKFFAKNKDICKILLSEIWQFESKWKQKYIPRRDQYIDAMKSAIEYGQSKNIFDSSIDSLIASTAIFGMVATSALDVAVSGEKSFQKAEEMVTKIALSGLLLPDIE
jgi:AcrR family transcriptional regulator